MNTQCVLRQSCVADVWTVETADRENALFHFSCVSKSWTHTDINNIVYKTHGGSALTNYYRRSAMTLIVAILDESFLFCENE